MREALPTGKLPLAKQALLRLEQLQTRIDELEQARTEPLAIVGVGCRFPGGATDPETFWELLRSGRDAVTEIPADRWDVDAYYDPDPGTPGRMYTREGGFLDAVDGFDAAFFGISPREAALMDPQQRLLLEVSWEALENANIVPGALLNSSTGVFTGVTSTEYAAWSLWSGDEQRIDAYSGTGGSLSVAAGRLSYVLGLTGPSVALDTACSSALVALHLACQSLRLGECDLALAGGVNLILRPELHINFCKARMLAPDGRCKTFDASANGYGRGEGCGCVALKRLSDAVAAGDRVLAQVRGSAVNHDGPSGGLTVPNAPSQERVIRRALAAAGIDPGQIDYIEAHGTGTSLGDPIEMGALGKVFGPGRGTDRPLVVGSVKTNVGHLEAAAGMASLIKVVLALQHAEIPPHLHFAEPSPHIDWDAFPVEIPVAAQSWPALRDSRLAGVSSFGFSGTNCHVVLESAPQGDPATEARSASVVRTHAAGPAPQGEDGLSWRLLPLAARTPEALASLARSWEHQLAAPAQDLSQLCAAAGACRTHFEHRLAAVGQTREQLRERLAAAATGEDASGVARGRASGDDPLPVAFLFSGQGSQYAGMGRLLFQARTPFRESLEECAELLGDELDQPLLDLLLAQDESSTALDQTAYTQPALFALEYALVQQWRSWGVEPAVLMGHSVGEYVAACVAGVFSLADGLRLIAARGRLMQALPGNGAMVAIRADVESIQAEMAAYADRVALAAINGPRSVVISGERQAVLSIESTLAARDVETRQLQVSHAFHSPLMEPMLDDFAQVAAQIGYSEPHTTVVSNLTGQAAEAEISTPEYWVRHVREPVRFATGMQALAATGTEVFLEVGPRPVLLGMGRRCLPAERGVWLPSLRPNRNDLEQMHESAGELYVRGAALSWPAVNGDPDRRHVSLPTYPFQRQRHWLPAQPSGPARVRRGEILHPLVHRRLESSALPAATVVYETDLDPAALGFLAHHRIFGQIVLPAAAHLEMALAAGSLAMDAQHSALADVAIQRALVLAEGKPRTVQVVLHRDAEPGYLFEILSLGSGDGETGWVGHSAGRLLDAPADPRSIDLNEIRKRCRQPLSPDEYYRRAAEAGIEHGTSFQALEEIWQHEGEVLARMRLPEFPGAAGDDFHVHPVLLDAALQLLGVPLLGEGGNEAHLPVGVDRLTGSGSLSGHLWCWLRMAAAENVDDSVLTADIALLDEDGTLRVDARGVHFQRVDPRALAAMHAAKPEDWLYRVEWEPQSRFGQATPAFTPVAEIGGTLAGGASALLEQLSYYGELGPRLNQIGAAYAMQALEECGHRWHPGERFTTTELVARLAPPAGLDPLLDCLLRAASELGVVQRDGDVWCVQRTPGPPDPQSLVDAALGEFPAGSAEVELLVRCGSQLGAVLQGRCEPLNVLIPDGDLSLVTRFYRDAEGEHAMNQLLQKALLSALAAVPQEHGVRFLEIGAGTGATTTGLLALLDRGRTEYTFTDISPMFTSRAEQVFGEHPSLCFQVLDIERDPGAQGFAAHGYDVVIAANVLHATRDMSQTLRHVRSLMAPGGLLLLQEGTFRQLWLDLIFGLTEGWWRFADTELRPDHALLSGAAWETQLRGSGFSQVVSLPGETARRQVSFPQAVIVAQADATGAVTGAEARGHALVLADPDVGPQLAAARRAAGGACTVAYPGEAFAASGERTYTVRPTSADDFQRLVEAAIGDAGEPTEIVHCWSLDADADPDPLQVERLNELGCGSVLHLLQALGQSALTAPPALWLVTRGAVSTQAGSGAENTDPVKAAAPGALWGLGKTIALEHPELRGVRLDLGDTDPVASARALIEEMRTDTPEDQVALRPAGRFVARMARMVPQQPAAAAASAESLSRPDDSWLITGGLGALGLRVAEWLVAEHGVRHLALAGRSGPGEAAAERLQELRSGGAEVLTLQADVSVPEQVAAMVRRVDSELPPVRGVIHAAGILADGVLMSHSWDRFAAGLAPKIQGSWNLHRHTLHWELDHFVLFSSAAALLGSPGQGSHAAANACMDALAHYRSARGRPALSINWGGWSGIGAASEQGAAEWMAKRGVGSIDPDTGLRLLEELLRQPACQVGVVPVDWRLFGGDQTLQPFFARLVEHAGDVAAAGDDLWRELESLPAAERSDFLIAHLQELLAAVLALDDPESVEIEQGFFDLGMDSLTSVELRNRLQDSLGHPLPATLLFKYPSVAKLAEYISREWLQESTEEPLADADDQQQPSSTQHEVQEMSEEDLARQIEEEFRALELGSDN